MTAHTASFATFNDFAIADWKRHVFGFVASMLAGAGIGVLGESLSMLLMYGTFILTGSSLVALTIYIIGFALTMVGAFYAGAAAGRYVFDRHIDRDAAALRDGAKALWGKAAAKFGRKAGVTLH